jgi:hypothetical protein
MRTYYSGLLNIIIALCLSGCFPSTKYAAFKGCEEYLSPSDKVIFYYINEPECEECFNTAEKVFKKRGITALFIPAQEYNFRKAGILNPLDSQYHALLRNKIGVTHFVLAELTRKNESDVFFDYTPYDVAVDEALAYTTANSNRSQITKDNNARAEVKFSLYSLAIKRITYRLTVTTTLSSISTRRRDGGGQTEFNFGNSSMATSKAIKNGTRRILKRCRQ